MPDYQKGKIYKLVSDHTDEIYIGSTCQLLCHRLSQHARDFREGKNKCTCKNMFELGKVKIVLIENVPCDSKEELYKRERHYIETMNCVNKAIPGRTMGRQVVCECGLTSTYSHLSRHKRTKKHFNLMKSKTVVLNPTAPSTLQ